MKKIIKLDWLSQHRLQQEAKHARQHLLSNIDDQMGRLARLRQQVEKREPTTAGASTVTESLHQELGRYNAAVSMLEIVGLKQKED